MGSQVMGINQGVLVEIHPLFVHSEKRRFSGLYAINTKITAPTTATRFLN